MEEGGWEDGMVLRKEGVNAVILFLVNTLLSSRLSCCTSGGAVVLAGSGEV